MAFGNFWQSSRCMFWQPQLYNCFHFRDFFCKLFESVILWTMAIATLVISLIPFRSCIKKVLMRTRIREATWTISQLAATVNQCLPPQKFKVYACPKVSRWESQGNPYLRRKRNSVKTIHCEVDQSVRVFQTSYSTQAIMVFSTVCKKKWVWGFMWHK